MLSGDPSTAHTIVSVKAHMAGGGWTSDETVALLSVWGEEKVQQMLAGVKRNRIVYEGIAARMGELGWERTWEQCRTKMKNLVSRYRKVSLMLHRIVVVDHASFFNVEGQRRQP